MTRIKKLTLLLIGLVIFSTILFYLDSRSSDAASINKKLFAIPKSATIDRLSITNNETKILLTTNEKGWMLNGKFKVDPSVVALTHKILGQVAVQRKVSPLNFLKIKEDLISKGRKVSLTLNDGVSKTFYAGGNANKTTAYFATEDLADIYIVAIPGYASYLSGIFELTLGQWRDRMLFASTWRTLQRLEIIYFKNGEESLSIYFEDKFLSVAGISSLDTAFLMAYLAPMEYFQLNDYLKRGAFPRYDSLSHVQPFAKLIVKDINQSNNRTLTIYPKISGERFYLLTDKDSTMIVVDALRMEKLLVSPSKFMSKL